MQNRIDRRAFVESLVVLPIGAFLVRCSSSSSSNTPPEPGAAPTVSGSQAIYTSSVVQNHDHTFALDLADFVNPPSGGVSGDTSLNASHTHQVSIPMGELETLKSGSVVAITTTVVSGHSHTFTFIRLSPGHDAGLVTP